MKVAFIDFVFENRKDIQLEGFEFSIHPPLRTGDQIVAAAADADVLCMRDQFGQMTADVFQRLPNLKLIVTRSVGYDHIDLDEAKLRGIPVCHIPDYGAHMIAEQAFGLLLAVARNVVRGNERYKLEHRFSDQGLQGVNFPGKQSIVLVHIENAILKTSILAGFNKNRMHPIAEFRVYDYLL